MGTQPFPQKGHSPQFSSNVRCGQTAGWTKMPLCVEVGLGTGDFVFDGDPAPPRKKRHSLPPNFWPRWGRSSPPLKGAQPPVFGPCILWPNGWVDEYATWYGSRARSTPQVLDGDPAPPQKGHSAPPPFSPCLLWPRSPISATVEVLYTW